MKSLLFPLLCVLSAAALGLDREAFAFTHYNLEARVEPAQHRLGVRGKITLRNDSDAAQKNAVLQISSTLNWLTIQIANKPAQFLTQTYTSDIDHNGTLSEAIVTLPKPIEPKATITLEVGYEGVVLQDATRLTRIGAPVDDAKHSDWDQISSSFTGVRGIGNVAWYPIATDSASLSEGDSLQETVRRWKRREADSEMVVNFSRLAEQSTPVLLCGDDKPPNQSGGNRQCVYRNLDSDVPFFAISEFQSMDRAAARIFFLSGHNSQADECGMAVDEAAEFTEKWLPARPSAMAEIIELADAKAAPFESGGVLLMPFSGDDSSYLLSATAVLTQTMFRSPRAWIRDGLARFAQASFIQEKEGHDAAIEYLRGHRQALLESARPVAATDQAARSLINSDDDFFIQAKAMNVWWMLRDIVGDAALKAALRDYKSDEDKSPQYVQKLIQTEAHKDLEWFFDDWVYRDHGLPDFRIVSVYPRELVNGGYMVTVTVENRGAAGAEIPVSLHMANGESSERLIVPAKSTASVRIVCPSLPRQATVNDGSVPESDESNNVYKIEQNSH